MGTLDRMQAASKTVIELERDGTKLGSTQRDVLKALLRHGSWPGGWIWDNHSGTRRVLDALVKKGLVQADTEDGIAIRATPKYTPSERVRGIWDRHYQKPVIR